MYYPKGNLEKVQSFREKYDQKFKVILPHITLVFPFDGIPEEKVIQHLDSVIKDFQVFPMHLNGLMKSFDNYLFLLVQEGKKEIEKIHEELYSGILDTKFTTDIPFIPHITLGEFSDKAFSEANDLNVDIHCIFDSINLIKGDGTSPATMIQAFNLKS